MAAKSFKELGFKVGDKVRCLTSSLNHNCEYDYKAGEVYTLERGNYGYPVIIAGGFTWKGDSGTWELVEDKMYKTYEELEVGDKIQALPSSMYTFDFYPEGDIGYVTGILGEGRLKADFSKNHTSEGLYFRDGDYKILEEKKQTKGNGVAMIYWADTNEFVKEVPVQIDVKVTFLEE